MTGCVILYRNINVVVVEGGPNQQKKFKRLMLQRIKWNEEDSRDGNDHGNKVENKCMLVWEGTVTQRSFGDIMFKLCPTETFAREFFKKRGVEHYWDLVYGTSILEAAEDA
ncbi:U4/U6 small nuclear ribonucleoprotein Prp3-like [Parasteatoda tepidariorum]|uniref:U4/U6 small nuclear ribonucleoprotein Prp3-like n=1 Tax=Parasteatoda tepidariorum TaxID=114398 RepID=UPI0039BD1557